MKHARPIPFYKVKMADGFWRERTKLNSRVTISAVYDRFVETGRFAALKCNWTEEMGEGLRPHYFWDSDVAKWIEGAAYLITDEPDSYLEGIIDEMADHITALEADNAEMREYIEELDHDKRIIKFNLPDGLLE